MSELSIEELAKAKNIELAIHETNLHMDVMNSVTVFKRNPKILELTKKKRENIIARLSTDRRCKRVEIGFETPYALNLQLKGLIEEENDLVVN